VARSPLNRLAAFGGAPIFEEPLVGFADGKDAIFESFREVVHPHHLTPGEIMAKELGFEIGDITVVSFVLPINGDTKKENAREKDGPSLRWNHTRWHGQNFIDALSRHLVSALTELGIPALAPELTSSFAIENGPWGYASRWSQRHIAYAAGLGTFGLSDALITEKGCAMRCGSVVVAHKMEITPRPYTDHHAYCLYFRTGKCKVCMKRCPRGAITPQGHDKVKCFEILTVDQRPYLEGAHGPGYTGKYAGCGLCQTAVPCEGGIPSLNEITP